jgi:hypothetical protein
VTPATFELPAMSVLATPSASVDLVQLRGQRLTWCGDAFEWTERRAEVQGDGTFEIPCLGRRSYRVALAGATAYLSPGSDSATRAPARGVELSLANVACEVRLSFFERGLPRADSSFSVAVDRGRGGQSLGAHRTDAQGRAVLWVEPGATAEVIVRNSGPGQRSFELQASAGGSVVEQRIDL